MWRQGTSSVLERRDVFRFERRSEQTRPDSNRLVSAKTDICVADLISIIVFLLELDDFLCLWLLLRTEERRRIYKAFRCY